MSNDTAVSTPASTPATAEKIKFCSKSCDGSVVSFNFGDGTTMSLDVMTLPEQTQLELMLHGMEQKGGDSYAGAAGDYGFAKANLARVITNLQAGLFNAGRLAGEAKPKTADLAEALASIQNMEIAEAQAIIDALDVETRKQVRNDDSIKAKLAEIKAAKAAEAARKAREAVGTKPAGFDLASLRKVA